MATQNAVSRLLSQNMLLRMSLAQSFSSQAQVPPKSPKKKASTEPPTAAASSSTQTINTSTYVSPATPKAPSNPVGPGASKAGDYKNPEYFCYNEVSYYDLELEMMKDRLPQPKSGNEML